MSLTEDQNESITPSGDAEGAQIAVTPAAETDESLADTSTADGEKSFTDAVLSALDEPEDSPASTENEGAAEDKPADAASDDAAKDADKAKTEGEDESDLTEKEMAALNDKTRTRIQTLLEQRRERAAEVETLQSEVEKLRPAAESYAKVTDFMRENKLTAEDAGQALQLAGLVNRSPTEAYAALKPIMEKLAEQAGMTLPSDLADDVRAGRITQQRALELSQARAQSTLSKRQADEARTAEERQQKEAEQERERAGKVEHIRKLTTIGDQLAADRAQSDPDWKLKEPLVVDKLRIDLADNGLPKDEAELKTRFDKIVKDVTVYLRGLQPDRKPQLKPVPSGSSTDATTEPPKDATEAVLRALG